MPSFPISESRTPWILCFLPWWPIISTYGSKGTKAFKAIIGLLVLGVIFTIAKTWGLFLTTWVFQFMWQILIILIVVLFQSEIRQVLEKVNPLQRLGLRRMAAPGGWASGFAEGIFALAREKTGALVIIRRGDKVDEHITEGQRLEADPTPETLKTIFQKESPFHDGAVLLKEGQIVEVACYLPLSPDEGLPRSGALATGRPWACLSGVTPGW